MASTPASDPRPLSPHLQVWKFHATMAASIMHRMTGVGLYVGSILFAAWIVSAAIGSEAYEAVFGVMMSIPGQILMFLWTLAVTYHFANGIRHMMWDGPKIGFTPKVASAWSVGNFLFSILASAGLWTLGYMTVGGAS